MFQELAWCVAGLVGGVAADQAVSWARARPERRYKRYQEVWTNPSRFGEACAVLENLYGTHHPPLTVGESTYPCVVWATMATDPEDLLVRPLATATDARVVAKDDEYRRAVEARMRLATGKGMYPGDIYCLEKVCLEDGRAALECSVHLGGFFEMLDSCEALEYELLTCGLARSSSGRTVGRWRRRGLRLRRALHGAVPDPVVDGSGRVAGVGGSTVTIYRDSGGYRVLVPKRSQDNVAGQRSLYAVAPAFIMEASQGRIAEEFSVARNVTREYAEELFGQKRESSISGHADHHEGLAKLLQSGSARLLPLGITMNLLNLRPDVCTLLLIDDPDWAKGVRLSSEYSIEGQSRSTLTLAEHLRKLDVDHRLEFAPHEIAPACAGALWMALAHPRVRSLN